MLELTLHKQETFPPSKMDVLSTIVYIVLLGLLWFVKLSQNENYVLYYNKYSKQHNFSSHIPESTFGCFQLLRSSTMEGIVISKYGKILSIDLSITTILLLPSGCVEKLLWHLLTCWFQEQETPAKKKPHHWKITIAFPLFL